MIKVAITALIACVLTACAPSPPDAIGIATLEEQRHTAAMGKLNAALMASIEKRLSELDSAAPAQAELAKTFRAIGDGLLKLNNASGFVVSNLSCKEGPSAKALVCNYQILYAASGMAGVFDGEASPKGEIRKNRTDVKLTYASNQWNLDDSWGDRRDVVTAAALETFEPAFDVLTRGLLPPKDQWKPFSVVGDKMSGSVMQGFGSASLENDNGGAQLLIRCDGNSRQFQLLVTTSKMVDYNSDNEVRGRIKFDEGNAENRWWKVLQGHDGMGTVGASDFIRKALSAKIVKIEVPRFRGQADVYTFSVVGLQDKLATLPDWCKSKATGK